MLVCLNRYVCAMNIYSETSSISLLFLFLFLFLLSSSPFFPYPTPLSIPSIYSSQITLVTSPGTSTSATNLPNLPLTTSRSTTTTRALSCNPTAASPPSLLTENCLGNDPPAGANCRNVSSPVRASMPQLCSESDAMDVPLLGSKFGIVKALSLRQEVRKYLLSGCHFIPRCR